MDESRGGAVLEEVEESKAFFQVYDGAVYMYQVGGCRGVWGGRVCGWVHAVCVCMPGVFDVAGWWDRADLGVS